MSIVSSCAVGKMTNDSPDNDSSKTADAHKHQTEEEHRLNPFGLVYGVKDTPPIHMCFLFGLQQVLLSISSTISIPLIVSVQICAGHLDLVVSEIMATFLFMCGVTTVLQVVLGVRLPILQGGCHKFIPAVYALMALEQWKCPTASLDSVAMNITTNVSLVGTVDEDAQTEIWQSRMREIQGSIMAASVIQVLIGTTGMMGFLLRFIGPLTIIPCITLVGLSLVGVAIGFCQSNWGIAALTVMLVFIFALYMSEVRVPLFTWTKKSGCHLTRYPIFKLLPVILAVSISWALCAILTVTDVLPNEGIGKKARTDGKLDVLHSSQWFFIPYPGQWGMPTVTGASFVAMFAATITSIIESTGDYYACARISSAPPPPEHAVNRGIFMEGIGSLISGAVGSGGATTSYSQNVGAIGFTKVASRGVFIAAGCIFIVCGLIGKFGAFLTTIPDPVLGGVIVVSFGMVTAVGLSNLQFVSLTSSRNLTILGSAMLIGLMLPQYLAKNPGAIKTGNAEFDNVCTVLLSTAMFVGGVIGFVLDNTVPGTEEERGIVKWRMALIQPEKSASSGNINHDNQTQDTELSSDVENGDIKADTPNSVTKRVKQQNGDIKNAVEIEQFGSNKSFHFTQTDISIYDIPLIMPLLRKLTCLKYVPICPMFTGFRACFKWRKKAGVNHDRVNARGNNLKTYEFESTDTLEMKV